jgi:hypothetical protein
MILQNEFKDEYGRLIKYEHLLTDYYYNTLITYKFLWTKQSEELYKLVSKYLFKILLQKITYEQIRYELKDKPYYLVDDVIYHIQVILYDKELTNDVVILEYIKVDRELYFMYLIYILTRVYFSTLKMEKYTYEKFYHTYFIFNLGEKQTIYINLFRIIDTLNKHAL